MKIIIPEIPPSLNKYAGRANTWDYRAEKQRWLQLFVAYCPNCGAKMDEKEAVYD